MNTTVLIILAATLSISGIQAAEDVPKPISCEELAAGSIASHEFEFVRANLSSSDARIRQRANATLWRLFNSRIPIAWSRWKNNGPVFRNWDDIVQEAAIATFRYMQAGKLESLLHLNNFISLTLKRKAIDSVRKKYVRGREVDIDEQVDLTDQGVKTPEDLATVTEMVDKAREALKTTHFTPNQTEFVRRYFLEGQSLEEISEAMGKSYGWSKVTLVRIKAKLQLQLVPSP